MSDTPTPETSTAPPAGWKVKSKFMGIGLLIGLLGGGGVAGKVYLDLSGTIDSLEQRSAESDTREAALLARSAVAAAATELQSQNYGNAKKNVEVAKLKLSSIDTSAGHLDASVLQTITDRLDEVNVSADASSAGAGSTLGEIGLALDRLLAGG